MRNILIELSDEELRLVSEQELKDIEKSAIEFDGFLGHRVVGYITPSDSTELINKAIEESFIKVSMYSDRGQFVINGNWYAGKWGCDSVQHFIDILQSDLPAGINKIIDDNFWDLNE